MNGGRWRESSGGGVIRRMRGPPPPCTPPPGGNSSFRRSSGHLCGGPRRVRDVSSRGGSEVRQQQQPGSRRLRADSSSEFTGKNDAILGVLFSQVNVYLFFHTSGFFFFLVV